MAEETILPVFLEKEMKESYLTYAMSVIIQRALPDVRDGLKPSQRRILVAMNDLNLAPGAQHRKCAKIAGDTSGNYHPHGEQVIYPTLVRMAQGFNLRYPLVDGQGNFGSIDGDPPAAMRYTEARMAAPAMELLEDLDKDTVDFISNYDETKDEPRVLPGKFPNLVVNGCSGIAVGMATNIPPHNIREVGEALIALIDDPELPDVAMLDYVRGPDFPTGGVIHGTQGIRDAYLTGHGRLTVRARTVMEEMKGGRERIVVQEIPYQVNKTALIEKIAGLVRDGDVEGIADIRDESDRKGMRIVIELKKDAPTQVILNQLFQRSQLQDTFGVSLLALVDGGPRVMTLKQLLTEYLRHRREVVDRRTRFDLEKAKARAHILEGLRIALDNIDAIIDLIRSSADPAEAKQGLMERFGLSEKQAQAILDMRLQRLTGLERKKLEEEYLGLIQTIEDLESILRSEARVREILKDEIRYMIERFGDDRRTDIIDAVVSFDLEDLIADEDMVVTISHNGYIKRLRVDTYRKQRRGGRGITGTVLRDEDFVENLFIASTHSYVLFFTDQGRCYWLKAHQIPQAGRTARGKAIVNLIRLRENEKITATVPVREFRDDLFLLLATRKGTVKKTPLTAYSNPRRVGIHAILLDEGDSLIEAKLTDGTREIVLSKALGKAIRFHEGEVRPMGRTARGVRGVICDPGDEVVGMVTLERNGSLLMVTENGYGKRTTIDEYRITRRGGKGIITVRANDRNGRLVAIREVIDSDELMIMSRKGIIIRMAVGGISLMGRNTQGVHLINLDEGDTVVGMTRVVTDDTEELEVGSEPDGDEGGGD
ncbi:MAG: DNA gyrase subunit A [Candidatus Eisenbacteria bacterium]|nr:DNA gyrase subunit A [Candidatus Eisenbacteria bacterium]